MLFEQKCSKNIVIDLNLISALGGQGEETEGSRTFVLTALIQSGPSRWNNHAKERGSTRPSISSPARQVCLSGFEAGL